MSCHQLFLTELLAEFSHKVLCNAIVVKVSPNCMNVDPKRLNSSVLSLHANAFAIAVIDAVNSHGFIITPLMIVYEYIIKMFRIMK